MNQLLAEMDGFDTSKGLLILAATNRPEVLDKALLRPGRFDRRIIVDKPDLKGRVETLKVHAKNVLMDDTVDLDAIALATSGAVGSDLANMINEAAINAVKAGRKFVNQEDLFESVEVVIAGKEKKDRIMGPKEKKMVAYHEVGHALVTALQKDTEPVQKITIVPRTMGALGYTMQVPEEEKFLMTKNELAARLVTYMGGRAAEEIVFDSVTTGASNDIEQATKIARAMVTQYGMSEKFGLMGLVTIENQYLDGRASLNCGEETAAQIDQEVMRILKASYDEAVRLLQENRRILDEISQYLYEHETITGKEFMKIFRELKGIPESVEKSETEKEAEDLKLEENPLEVNTLGEIPLKVDTLQGDRGYPPERNVLEEERLLQENTPVKDSVFPMDVDTMREIPLEINTMGDLADRSLKRDNIRAADDFSQQRDVLMEEPEGYPLEINTLEESERYPLEINTLDEADEFLMTEDSFGFNILEEPEDVYMTADGMEQAGAWPEPEMSAAGMNMQEEAEINETEQKIQRELTADEMLQIMLEEAQNARNRKRLEEEQEVVFLEAEEIAENRRQVIPEELTWKVFNRETKATVKNAAPNIQRTLSQELSEKKAPVQSADSNKQKEAVQKVQKTVEKVIHEKAQEPVQEDGEDYLDKLLKGIK